jgi:hypothetical protein
LLACIVFHLKIFTLHQTEKRFVAVHSVLLKKFPDLRLEDALLVFHHQANTPLTFSSEAIPNHYGYLRAEDCGFRNIDSFISDFNSCTLPLNPPTVEIDD